MRSVCPRLTTAGTPECSSDGPSNSHDMRYRRTPRGLSRFTGQPPWTLPAVGSEPWRVGPESSQPLWTGLCLQADPRGPPAIPQPLRSWTKAPRRHTDHVLTVRSLRMFKIFQNKNWRGTNSIKQTEGGHGPGQKPMGEGLCLHPWLCGQRAAPTSRPHEATGGPVRGGNA